VLDFVVQDDFWVKNALGPMGLLTRGKNGLRKIDNILAAMKSSKEWRSKQIEQGGESCW